MNRTPSCGRVTVRSGLGRRPVLLALAATPWSFGSVHAADWPSRPLRIIVPMPPGGAADSVARPLAARLARRLGTPVWLDHRPGAGTVIGTQALARANADGYTIGMVVSAHAINAAIDKPTPYDALGDFAPICLGGTFIVALVANPALPAGTVGELVAYAKGVNPQPLYASLGSATGTHLAGEMFNAAAGLTLGHVAYHGSSALYPDLLSGRVTLGFVTLDSALPYLRSRRLKLIGITSEDRSPSFPDYPTIGETLAGYRVPGFFGFLAPAGTPQRIVARLASELIATLEEPDIARQFARLGIDIDAQPPEVFERSLRDEIARYAATARRIGMKAD